MAVQRKRIELREVKALAPGAMVWDGAVLGFCARRQQSEAVAYCLKYRTADGRQRWHTIGRHGAPWTPEEAREEARRLLGEVTKGADPATDKRAKRDAATVSELCDLYLADAEAGRLLTRRGGTKKASTLTTDRSRISAHIKPILGATKVPSVTREDVEAFMHAVAEGATRSRAKTGRKYGLSNVRGGKGASSRTVGLLGAIFTYAVRKRMRADNPVQGVVRHADGRRERRLTDAEYAALGAGLRAAALPVPRKTPRRAGLPERAGMWPAALASRGNGIMSGFPGLFERVAKAGGLPADVTPHVLRHSFASLAGDVGYSETTIAALVGHKGQSITSRYVHAADAVLLTAADAVAGRTAELMGEAAEGVVVPLPVRAVA